MTEVRWRVTDEVPDSELDLRCDLCGRPANTVHLVGVYGALSRVARGEEVDVDAVLACSRHDAGGYWIPLERVWADGVDSWVEHLGGKGGPDLVSPHLTAFGKFLSRLDAARRAMAEGERRSGRTG